MFDLHDRFTWPDDPLTAGRPLGANGLFRKPVDSNGATFSADDLTIKLRTEGGGEVIGEVSLPSRITVIRRLVGYLSKLEERLTERAKKNYLQVLSDLGARPQSEIYAEIVTRFPRDHFFDPEAIDHVESVLNREGLIEEVRIGELDWSYVLTSEGRAFLRENGA